MDKRSPQALRLRLGIRMNPFGKVGDWIIWWMRQLKQRSILKENPKQQGGTR